MRSAARDRYRMVGDRSGATLSDGSDPSRPDRYTRYLATFVELLERPEWHARALCRRPENRWYFYIAWKPPTEDQLCLAREVCSRCPVVTECESWAREHKPSFGIWAGLTPDEIDPARRRGPIRQKTGSAEQRRNEADLMHVLREAGSDGITKRDLIAELGLPNPVVSHLLKKLGATKLIVKIRYGVYAAADVVGTESSTAAVGGQEVAT